MSGGRALSASAPRPAIPPRFAGGTVLPCRGTCRRQEPGLRGFRLRSPARHFAVSRPCRLPVPPVSLDGRRQELQPACQRKNPRNQGLFFRDRVPCFILVFHFENRHHGDIDEGEGKGEGLGAWGKGEGLSMPYVHASLDARQGPHACERGTEARARTRTGPSPHPPCPRTHARTAPCLGTRVGLAHFERGGGGQG